MVEVIRLRELRLRQLLVQERDLDQATALQRAADQARDVRTL